MRKLLLTAVLGVAVLGPAAGPSAAFYYPGCGMPYGCCTRPTVCLVPWGTWNPWCCPCGNGACGAGPCCGLPYCVPPCVGMPAYGPPPAFRHPPASPAPAYFGSFQTWLEGEQPFCSPPVYDQ